MVRNQHRTLAAILSGCFISLAQGAVPIFGGPTYSASPVPHGAQSLVMPSRPLHSVGEGFAAGFSTSFDSAIAGQEADLGYRWDTSRTVVSLGNRAVLPFLNGDVTVTGISSRGAAIGTVYSPGFIIPNSGGTSAMYWSLDNTPIGLQKLPSGSPQTGGQVTVPYAVNRSDVIVGGGELWSTFFSTTINLGERAIRWDTPTSVPTNLGTPSLKSTNVGFSQAVTLNDAGQVAGYYSLYGAEDANLGLRAVRWAPGSTTPIPLGALGTNAAGITNVEINRMNASGTIVGSAETFGATFASTGPRAVRWEASSTAATQLGGLSANLSGVSFSTAYDINDAGVVVGNARRYAQASNTNLGTRPVRWNANSTVAIEMGTLGSSSTGRADASVHAINNLGVSVGDADQYLSGAFVNVRATMWRASGAIVDLNSFLPANSGWELITALDISEAGFISGIGNFDPDGASGQAPYQRGFMLLVPEAGTYGRGDANFDGAVNFDDLLILAQHYASPNPSLSANVGDLNLDGAVGFDDLLILAQHYGSTPLADAPDASRGGFSAGWELARSIVPEPACLSLGTVLLFRQGRGRRIQAAK